MTERKLRGAVVGCRGMGRHHAAALHKAQEVKLVGVCDLDAELAAKVVEELPGARAFGDLEMMLAELRPEILAIATPNVSHCALTLRAAEAGVRGICCEKPMAMGLGEARAMIDACQRYGAQLIIHHQRRTMPALVKARELILDGAIGEVQVLRGTCSGDLLTDGTHLIDSLLHFAGDEEVAWVFGALYRDTPAADAPRGHGFTTTGGYRYGHPVETGSMGTWEFRSGVRAEIFTGALHLPGRKYNDYEILGTKGRLWRPSDMDDPGLYLQGPGTEAWQPVDVDNSRMWEVISDNYDLLARQVRAGGGGHPLSAERALRGLEVLMALYESARLRARIELPLQQEGFPLQLMLDAAEQGGPD